MMNRNRLASGTLLVLAAAGVVGLTLTGCGSEPEQQAVERPNPAPQPAAAPPKPQAKAVDDLMAELRIDERIHLPEDRAPSTTEARRAVLEYFDAYARGDHEAAGRMMSELDRRQLEKLVESGRWRDATSKIKRIDIQTGDSEFGKCALALYDLGERFEAQLWYYDDSGDTFDFSAASTPPNIVDRLSGTDWIAAWHEVLAEERELAMKPDETITIEQQNLDTGESSHQSGSSAPSRPTGPIGVPSAPPGNRPAPPSRKPPGNPVPPR